MRQLVRRVLMLRYSQAPRTCSRRTCFWRQLTSVSRVAIVLMSFRTRAAKANFILLAENTNQDGQATGDMLELAPRQGHELTSPIPIQSWRCLQSSSPTRTRTLSSPWPRWCPTFPSLHPPYEWRINSLVRTFEDILSLFDLTIDTISFQAILNSLQKLERPWPNVLLILLNYNILLYRYFYFNKSI